MDSNDFGNKKSEEANKPSSSHSDQLYHANLERLHPVGGHVDDRSQPALPVYHRTFASPSPLGLISFATEIFLISLFGLQASGVTAPNVMVGCLLTAGYSFGFLVSFLSYWAGCAGLWGSGITPIKLPTFNMFTCQAV